MDDEEYEYAQRHRTFRDENLYEITGKRQRVWILGVVLVAVLVGLVYVLSQFG